MKYIEKLLSGIVLFALISTIAMGMDRGTFVPSVLDELVDL